MDFTKVTKFIDSLGECGIPGAALAIYLGDEEVYRRNVGVADLDSRAPITNDSLFPMYSMTKVVTSVAALQLWEEGRFLLQDPLCEYMPEFKEMTVRITDKNGGTRIKPAKSPIRIVDLFTMSSGYSYDAPGLDEQSKKTGGNATLRELVLALAGEPLGFEPGTHWCYGYSMDILGRLVEVLSGKTLGEYFQENIFAPLGMSDTAFKMPKEKHGRLVSCYAFDENKKEYTKSMVPVAYLNPYSGHYLSDEFLLELPGGGLISTVDDYAVFAKALCAGGTSAGGYRLLGKPTVELMRKNHLNRARMRDYNNGFWPHHRGYGYGLGVRTMADPARGGSSSSIGEFGWSGLAGTFVLMDPALSLTYVYAQQTSPSKEEYIAPRLRNIIYGCL